MSEWFTLLIRLEGPMQSWGYRSRFDYRDTALEPTRSGVIGMICAAMGIARGEDISRFNEIRMGIRVDKNGKIERDYHTARDVIKADGSYNPDTPEKHTIESHRDYLSDSSFTVGLESENSVLLEEIAKGLQSPTWMLYLGRKAFPLAAPPLVDPAEPVKPGPLEDHLLQGEAATRVILESPDGERTQHDWPVCFGERRFKPRHLTVTHLSAHQP